MLFQTISARYHEIGLKGKNKHFFINLLVRNIRESLSDIKQVKVVFSRSEILITYPDDVPQLLIKDRLSNIYGIAKFMFTIKLDKNLDAVKRALTNMIESNVLEFESFKVESKRADKSFPFSSMELNNEIGAFIKNLSKSKVNLKNPTVIFKVDVRENNIFVSTETHPGLGGLPVGSSAHVLTLLSGGIDSPVAANRVLKRGCTTSFIHFHSFPLVDTSSKDKAKRLVKALKKYQPRARLFLVPFSDIQMEIIAKVDPAYRVISYRRFMIRVGEAIAKQNKAIALVSGESIGQVASQTVENIATIDSVATIPILRPLIGMDKIEIINEAIILDTFNISIEPDMDCCSLMIPKKPVIKSTATRAAFLEKDLDVEYLIANTVRNTEIIDV